MLGVAVMQGLWGLAVATAPSTANTLPGPLWMLMYSGFFTVLWLVSAGLFRIAAAQETARARAA
jgi:hypothetical protein